MNPTFAHATWPQIRAALAGGRPVVAILPLGATEAHGPHLPLNTDVIISEGMAQYAVPELEDAGIAAFILPALAYAPAEYAAAFPGTISIGANAAKAVLLDIARSLKAQGFACLALANSHFDPANVTMLREAAAEIAALGLKVAFPDFTRRKLAQTLTAEFQSGACHAGQFETSLVMAARPELVDEDARRSAGDNPASLTEAFAKGAKTFEQAGGPQAYFGFPQQASAEEGVQTYEALAAALVAAVRAELGQ
ncbi:MAG: creatininase family protein [Planctomycetes bacterium]|jgi:creatinine amidohydrolase|nr:creatininase family protein [Planctomycetota bacterium]